jgi:metallophosphoesterase (TIGR00282 family)
VRVLFVGDIVGTPGVDFVVQAIPALRRQEGLHLVVANGENADAGSGISRAIVKRLLAAEVDCITLGDHAFRRSEILDFLATSREVIRPANFPEEAPGKGWTIVRASDGNDVAVINLIGRVFMKPVDCPFHCVDRILPQIPNEVVVRLVDFHAEATSDKQLMGRYLDGRVAMVLGTHTHVATADETILPRGTAFQCDVGMTGPHDGILGRQYELVLETTFSFYPRTFQVAKNDVQLNGAIVDIDAKTGQARSIRRFRLDENGLADLQEEY